MTEITFGFVGFFDAFTIFLQTLFGALGDLFAQLSSMFSSTVIDFA